MQSDIAAILRNTVRESCAKAANTLEAQDPSRLSLSLRFSNLYTSDVISIADCIKQATENERAGLVSLSLSYNPQIADDGVCYLMDSLPSTLMQLGLVGCGIGDLAGERILRWMEQAHSLEMVCIEGNSYSPALRKQFSVIGKANPNRVFVF